MEKTSSDEHFFHYAVLLGIILVLLLKTTFASKIQKPQSESLSLRFKKALAIKGWLDSWIHGSNLPNATIAIIEKDKEVFFHATGYADVEKKILCKRDTIYRIYSMTKPVTVAAVLLLIEKGLLNTNDPIDMYLPEFDDVSVYVSGTSEDDLVTEPADKKITIQHLLTHTSGISYAFLTDHVVGRILSKMVPNNDAANLFCNTPMSELVKYIAKAPLCFQPGSRWLYGLNTDLLGLIVERISGQPLQDFFEQHIFSPLGMKDTAFYVPPEKMHRLTRCYDVSSGHSLKPTLSPETDRSVIKACVSGGGGLVSTIDDYILFAKMLLDGKYKDAQGVTRTLLSPLSISSIKANYLPPGEDLRSFSFDKSFSETVGPGYGFGYGVSVVQDPAVVPGGALSSVEEFGWGGIATTSFTVDPINDIVIVFMTQLIPSRAYPLRSQIKWLGHWLCRDDIKDGAVL